MADTNPLKSLIEELNRHHLIVTGAPPPLPTEAGQSTTQPPETGDQGEPSGECEPSDAASVSSGELFQCDRDVTYSNKVRQKMSEKGLYNKHDVSDPLLKNFAEYLQKELFNQSFKQEVENVARYLYYADSKAPSLQFVNDREKLREYLRALSEAKLKKQTQQNYLKSLKRFLNYHTVSTNLRKMDKVLHKECTEFIEYIGSLQREISKHVGKEITQKRHNMLIEEDQLTTKECWAVLDAAKKDFLDVMENLSESSDPLESDQSILLVYYLEALVILKHLQRPGVVVHMTVNEWAKRKKEEQYYVIGVKQHKTAAHQVAIFALSEEEESWFDVYFRLVRPQLLRPTKKRKRDVEDESDAAERFFVSSTGRAIYNPSNDLMRLHSKYKLRSVTSQMARIAFETASKSLNDAERALVAGYLTHSSQTADKHYRMKNREHIVKGCQLLTSLVSVSSAESPGEGTSRESLRSREECSSHAAHHAVPSIKEPTISLTRLPSVNDSKTFSKAFETLLQTHPLSLNGKRPEMKKCKAVSKEFQEKLSSHWAKKQFEMRAQHACTYFSRRKPTKEQLQSWTSKQGWKNMAADCEKLLQNWAPSGSEDHIMDSKLIQTLVKSQKWRGLHIRECEGKGRGIITTRRFEAGEVLCDYHGPVVTSSEGHKTHKSTTESETGYMSFFTNKKGQSMCIDAHSDRCVCHPEIQTIGRLLNHSEEKANIKPKYFSMEMDGEERDVILFLATRTLLVGEEVLFDHDFYRGALD
ncbi:uncharacterized protein LOC115582623 [Sparus aurata]|nr:uncharacterized protein LOC115582623 [Sparus aurata]